MAQDPHSDGSGDAAPSGAPAPSRSGIRRFLTHRSLSIGVVAVIAGVLFATNAALFRTKDDRHAENIRELVAEEGARLEDATTEVEALRAEVQGLAGRAAGALPGDVGTPVGIAVAAGRLPVTGPGVVVKLWDAPASTAPEQARPDDLLVHQQDVEAVVNALWAGGAEAMTIQGQRVTSETAVRCVGNVLLLHGATYSPPYEIAAIGDTRDLLGSLYRSPGVEIYLEYVDAVGLGWSVAQKLALEMPAAETTSAMQYATVPDEALLEVLLASGSDRDGTADGRGTG